MSDAHDLHVLNDLIAAVRATDGAPSQAIDELEIAARGLGDGEAVADAPSVVDAVREALGGLLGDSRGDPPSGSASGGLSQRLEALMAQFEAAMADDRLSGPARDAVIRAFDPIKAARDAALQESEA